MDEPAFLITATAKRRRRPSAKTDLQRRAVVSAGPRAEKIARTTVSEADRNGVRYQTLILSDLGTYYILEEDPRSGEVCAHRITPAEARDFCRHAALGHFT